MVRIAEFKSRLSEHLRKVRAGHSLIVLDRDTPVARVVPWEEGALLKVRQPTGGAGGLAKVKLPPPLRLRVVKDAVALLDEERQGER